MALKAKALPARRATSINMARQSVYQHPAILLSIQVSRVMSTAATAAAHPAMREAVRPMVHRQRMETTAAVVAAATAASAAPAAIAGTAISGLVARAAAAYRRASRASHWVVAAVPARPTMGQAKRAMLLSLAA